MTEDRVTRWRDANRERYREQNRRHLRKSRAKAKRRNARIADMADNTGDQR